MKDVQTRFYCDVDHSHHNAVHQQIQIQVIFTTEQTEGRSVARPYLTMETLDLCDECMRNLMMGHYLFGEGAQGHNRYHFKGFR